MNHKHVASATNVQLIPSARTPKVRNRFLSRVFVPLAASAIILGSAALFNKAKAQTFASVGKEIPPSAIAIDPPRTTNPDTAARVDKMSAVSMYASNAKTVAKTTTTTKAAKSAPVYENGVEIVGTKMFDIKIDGDSLFVSNFKDKKGNSHILSLKVNKIFVDVMAKPEKIIHLEINGNPGALVISKSGVERIVLVNGSNKIDSISYVGFTLNDGSKIFTGENQVYFDNSGVVFATTPDQLIQIDKDGSVYYTKFIEYDPKFVSFKNPTIMASSSKVDAIDLRDKSLKDEKIVVPKDINQNLEKVKDDGATSFVQ